MEFPRVFVVALEFPRDLTQFCGISRGKVKKWKIPGRVCAAPFVEQLLRRALLNLIWQNYIEPGGNLLKDQAILNIKQCYLNFNYMRPFFLVQTRRSNIWSEHANTKQRIWTVVANKKVKVSCETISSVKYNCSNTLICRKIWYRWCRYLSKFLT